MSQTQAGAANTRCERDAALGSQSAADALDSVLAAADVDSMLEDLPGLIEESISSTKRITDIVRAMALFGAAGTQHDGVINPSKVLDAAVCLTWNSLTHRAEVVRDYAEAPVISGNASELMQVFVHVLRNMADRLGDRRGRVTVRACANVAHRVTIEIGVDVTNASSIGLDAATALVVDHDGTLGVHTNGEGVCIRVCLPLSRRQTRRGTPDAG